MFDFSEEMGGDEVVTMLVALAVALVGAIGWFATVAAARTGLRARPGMRALLAGWPLVCLGVVTLVLLNWADPVVRRDIRYILLFLAVGGAWLTALRVALPVLGISLRDDAIERRNPAAAWAICGAMLGVTLAYAGGNIGEGPTIWTTIRPAALASVALLMMWAVIQSVTRIADAITIDRDTASAMRLAAFLAGGGLILGRAVAGDWVSQQGTWDDLVAQGWPAVLLAALAAGSQWIFAPRPHDPRPAPLVAGAVPAAVSLAAAIGWVVHLGSPL